MCYHLSTYLCYTEYVTTARNVMPFVRNMKRFKITLSFRTFHTDKYQVIQKWNLNTGMHVAHSSILRQDNRIPAMGYHVFRIALCNPALQCPTVDVQCNKNGKCPMQMEPLVYFFIPATLFTFLSEEEFLAASNQVITTQFHILLLTAVKRV